MSSDIRTPDTQSTAGMIGAGNDRLGLTCPQTQTREQYMRRMAKIDERGGPTHRVRFATSTGFPGWED